MKGFTAICLYMGYEVLYYEFIEEKRNLQPKKPEI